MTCISQKSKISPRRSFLHGLSLFALACALPCYFSFAARRGCRRVPLNRSTPRRPCRRAAKTPQQRQMRTQARLQRPLCALSPSARSSLVHSRQAVAIPYGQALPIGAAALGQTLAIGSAAVALSPFFLSPRGALICPCRAFCAVSSLRAVSALLHLCKAVRGRIARLSCPTSPCHPQTALTRRLRAAIIGGECLAPYDPRRAVFSPSRPLDGLEIV